MEGSYTVNAFRTELTSAGEEEHRYYRTEGTVAYGADENMATAEKIEKSSPGTHHSHTVDP